MSRKLEGFVGDLKSIASHPLFFAASVAGVHIAIGLICLKWLFGRQDVVPRDVEPERRPILEVIEATRDEPTHVGLALNLPKTPPFLARTIVRLIFSKFGAWFMGPKFLRSVGVVKLQGQFIPEPPTFFPMIPPNVSEDDAQDQDTRKSLVENLSLSRLKEGTGAGFRFHSIAAYHEAYSQGRLSPVDVARAALTAIADSDRCKAPLRAFTQLDERNIMDLARASAERWKKGKPLSFVDGIPVAIKEEYKWDPLVYHCGSMSIPCGTDSLPNSELGEKLRDQGAIVLGVTNMCEFGTSPIGTNYNALHKTPRNPYNTSCYTGGSSSGSAASIAAGICALTLGTDGGGSVRIPSAFCGIVGIKPTYGRLVDSGMKACSSTVGHCGVHGGSVADVLLGYNMLAGRNPSIPSSLIQPPLSLKGVDLGDLKGLRIGYDEDYMKAACREVFQPCLEFVTKDLKDQYAEVKRIKIAELELTRLAHLVTISSEMACVNGAEVHKHFDKLNTDTLLVLGSGLHVHSTLYLNAQKQRTRAIAVLKKLFEEVDCIITPTTAIPAPEIERTDHKYGCTDSSVIAKSVGYVFIGNLTGAPCITVPIGYTEEGLPIGLQIMGRWWEENVIFRVAMVAERIVEYKGGLKKPKVYYDLLQSK